MGLTVGEAPIFVLHEWRAASISQVGAVPKVNVDNGTAPVCYGLSRSYASMISFRMIFPY